MQTSKAVIYSVIAGVIALALFALSQTLKPEEATLIDTSVPPTEKVFYYYGFVTAERDEETGRSIACVAAPVYDKWEIHYHCTEMRTVEQWAGEPVPPTPEPEERDDGI